MAETQTTVTLDAFSLDRVFQAVEDVRQRLLRATAALNNAGLTYAVVGGHAVANWVSRKEKAAIRNTQDVDILVRREDFAEIKSTLELAGFHHQQVMGVDAFLDSPDAHVRDSVHILYANELVKAHEQVATPSVEDSELTEHFPVISLEPLLLMKLTSFRRKDQVHIQDMIQVGLIDQTWTDRFDEPLKSRLQELLDDPYG